MYYEEMIVDGVLHCRTIPDGEFRPLSAKILTEELIRTRQELRKLRDQIEYYQGK